MADDNTQGIKSAYELALERMEQQGIDRPREDSLSESQRQHIAEIRQKADARLAELEILHRKHLAEAAPGEHPQLEENYRRDRRRVEDDRERQLGRARQGAGSR
ncbi:MAG: hypothetical protein AAGD01_13405 [Acidobacteriota bacterium]